MIYHRIQTTNCDRIAYAEVINEGNLLFPQGALFQDDGVQTPCHAPRDPGPEVVLRVEAPERHPVPSAIYIYIDISL